jgi:hypothetical protein
LNPKFDYAIGRIIMKRRSMRVEFNSRAAFVITGYIAYIVLTGFFMKVAYQLADNIANKIYMPLIEDMETR